jgi:hypothetical protein
MVDYIPFLAPIIVAGITGLSLTSLAFSKVKYSVIQSLKDFKSLNNLSSSSWLIDTLKEEEQWVLERIGFLEMLVITQFCISELSIAPTYGSALSQEIFKNPLIIDNVGFRLIIFSYILIVFGIIEIAFVYCGANLFKLKTIIPTILDDEERIKIREKIPQSP